MEENKVEVLQAVEKALGQITGFSDGLHPIISLFTMDGLRILTALAVAVFAWRHLKGVLQQKSSQEHLADAVVMAMTAAFVFFAITKLDDFLLPILAGFDWISGKVYASLTGLPAADIGSGVAIQKAASELFITVLNMWDSPSATEVKSTEGWGPFKWIAARASAALDGSMAMSLMMILMKFVMTILAAIAVIAFLSVYVISQTFILIALVLCPLLFPFWIVPQLSFIADGTFKFMLQAGMQKVVATFVLALSGSLIANASAASTLSDASLGAQFGVFLVVMIQLGIMTMLMLQAQSIAIGIMSGSSRGEIGMPAVSPGGAVRSGTGGAARVAGGTFRAGAGAWNGAKAGAAGGVRGVIGGAARGAFDSFKK